MPKEPHETLEQIREAMRLAVREGGTPDTILLEIPEDVMQEALEIGDMGGTPSEVRALEHMYAAGIQRAIDLMRGR